MYLAELALWFGWAILYGSLTVLAAFTILCVVVSRLAPKEERGLKAQFGGEYRKYMSRVPRWLRIL
jgi:protein-S-isoprenylcysteine O-methyltransferase Ste14